MPPAGGACAKASIHRSTCKAILSKPDRGVQVIVHLVGLYLLLIEDLA
jgi:hypothetical protein